MKLNNSILLKTSGYLLLKLRKGKIYFIIALVFQSIFIGYNFFFELWGQNPITPKKKNFNYRSLFSKHKFSRLFNLRSIFQSKI